MQYKYDFYFNIKEIIVHSKILNEVGFFFFFP